MSRGGGLRNLMPQLTLFGAFILTVSIVGYVTYSQEVDRARLRAGVQRDLERQRLKQLKREQEEME